MSLNFLLYLRVLIHAVSRTGLLKQRMAKSAFCVTHSIFSRLPPDREASSWQDWTGLCVHILIKLAAVLTGTPCCVTQPSIIFFGTFLFRKHCHSFLSFYQFLLVNTRVHYCSILILKLSQIRIRLYFLNRHFHLTVLV